MDSDSHRLTLRQLRFFLAVVDSSGFTAAAERLYVSQPSISNAIAELEALFGTALFVRRARRAFLTSDGEVLAVQARRIVAMVEETFETLSGTGERGLLSVGAGPSVGTYILPDVLGAFRKEHPGVTIQIKIAPVHELGLDLRARRIALCIVPGPLEGDLQGVRFVSSDVPFIASPADPMARAERLGLPDLAAETIIVRERDSWTHQVLERELAKQKVSPRYVLELGNNEAIKRAVAHGLGVAALPRLAVSEELKSGALAELKVDPFPVTIDWFLAWVEGDRLTRVARLFVEFASSPAWQAAYAPLPV